MCFGICFLKICYICSVFPCETYIIEPIIVGSLYVSIGNFLYLCTWFYNILMYEREYSPAFDKLRECNARNEYQPRGKEAQRKGKEAQRAGRAAGEVLAMGVENLQDACMGSCVVGYRLSGGTAVIEVCVISPSR